MTRHMLAVALSLIALTATSAVAAPITSFAYFTSVPHTTLTFEQDGSGATLLNPPNNYTFPNTEYAAQGVTINPDVRLAATAHPVSERSRRSTAPCPSA